MQVGDIVKHFLTDQLGIVVNINNAESSLAAVHVLWTTQGESLFGPGRKEWCSKNSLTVLTTA
tara:strand:+ start:334 stop:522 length:189 start_codon:yes stop_codon:yes gene_type:complete